MNNIDNLMQILESLGGSATTQEVAQYYCKNRQMVADSSYNSVITNVFSQNKNLVKYSSLLDKWELNNQSETNILRVSDNKYFRTEVQIMRELFDLKYPKQQCAYIEVDENKSVWFPKFYSKDWDNKLDENGKFWYETPLKDEETDKNKEKKEDNRIRYVFSYDDKLKYKFTGVFKYKETIGNTNIYEIIDDKIIIESKRKPLILCRIAWMNEYQGITETDRPIGAGEYVEKNNDALEKYNFLLREDNRYYGFVETKVTEKDSGVYRKINLENIDYSAKDKDLVSGVNVVFVSPNPENNKLTIVGWYENATIYRDRQSINGKPFVMTSEEAHLIKSEERNFIIPSKVVGQSDFYYIQKHKENKDLEQKILDYIDSIKNNNNINFFFEPINLNDWDMFEEIEDVGHTEYLLATKSMKVGDYILLHIGQQKADVESGVYAVAQIIESPVIYNGEEDEYCNGKLSVKTKIIRYSNTSLLSHKDCEKYITQFRSVHQINSLYNDEMFDIFINNSNAFKKYLEDSVNSGKIGKSTMDSYLSSINSMSKKWVGTVLPAPIYEIKDIDFLKGLYALLMDKDTEIGVKNYSGKGKMSSAIKLYYEFLETNNKE